MLSPEWSELFDMNKIKECLQLAGPNPMPDADLIFKAFSYMRPADCKIIILGQDPYPEGAQGISFSAAKLRVSVRNIFKCLRSLGLLEEMPVTGELQAWAERGVLMLNTMLTYGVPKHTFWIPAIDKMLNTLMMMYPQIVIFAWGEDAKKRTLMLPQHRVFSYAHPAAHLSEWKFNHFAQIMPPFGGWILKRFLRIYTDGACSGNGKNSARGGWACIMHHGYSPQPFGILWGRLFETNVLYNGTISQGYQKVPATNNRGEIYAIIVALIKAHRLYGECYIEIITDSMFAINTATDWMFKWAPHFEKKKNPDLTRILFNLSNLHKITYTHQAGHVENPKTPNEIGNAMADKYAVAGGKLDHFIVQKTEN